MKTSPVAETARTAVGPVVLLSPPFLLFGGTLLLYLLTTSYRVAIGDGASELDLASRPTVTFRPYHLLQTSLYRTAIDVWSFVGWDGPSLIPVQVLNVVLGSATIALFWLLLVRLELSKGTATFGAAFFAMSNAVWCHSVSADTGMTPMPFLLGAILLLCPRRPSPCGVLRISVTCALFSLAVVLSLNVVLMLPALLILVLRSPGGRSYAKFIIAIVSLGTFGLAPFMLVAIRDGHATPVAFVRWITYHPEDDAFRPILRTALQAPRAWAGIARLIFPKSDGETAIKGLLRSIPVKTTLGDWISLVRNTVSSVLLVCLAVHGFWLRRRETEARALAVAVILTMAFCLLWLGSDPQFWLPVYPVLLTFALIGLASLSISRSVILRASAATGICLLLFAVNSRMDLPTPLTSSGGTAWQEAASAAKALSAGDLVIGPGGAPLDWVSLVDATRRVLVLTYQPDPSLQGFRFLQALEVTIDEFLREGHRVFVYGLHDPVRPQVLGYWDLLLGKRGVTREEVRSFLGRAFTRQPAPECGDDVDQVLRRNTAQKVVR